MALGIPNIAAGALGGKGYKYRGGFRLEWDKASVRHSLKKLHTLGPAVFARVAGAATGRAMTPVSNHAKRIVRRRYGFLRKAVGKRTKRYRRTETAVTVVGARTKAIYTDPKYFGGQKIKLTSEQASAVSKGLIKPYKYAHLVEFGTYRSRAFPFISTAMKSEKNRVNGILKTELARGIAREGRKP